MRIIINSSQRDNLSAKQIVQFAGAYLSGTDRGTAYYDMRENPLVLSLIAVSSVTRESGTVSVTVAKRRDPVVKRRIPEGGDNETDG